MKKNLFIMSLAIAVAIPALVVSFPIDVDAATSSFKDVPKNSPYYDNINEMAGLKIISGYGDGTFRPNEVITRKHAAALVNRARGKTLPQAVKFVKFKDVSEKHANYNDIKALQQAAIFVPDAKGNFNPNQALTRAEMAKVLVMAFDLQVKAVYNFPDVPVGHTFSKYIQAIYSNGITMGDNGRFLPTDSLTRAHYAVFMHRAMNMDENFVAAPIQKPAPPVLKPIPKPPLPTERPILEPETSFKPSGLVPRSADVKKPAGWTPAIYDQHMKKIEETVFKYSPKKGTGVQFGKGGFGLYELDDPSFISMNEEQLKAIGSKSTIEEWIAGINYALETGDVYIAADNSYALYAQYSKSNTNGAAIIYIR